MRVKLLFVSLILMFTSCEAKNTTDNAIKSQPLTSKYVDFKRFSEGRPCGDVTFMCLPESQDKSWQVLKPDDSLDFFELSPAVMTRYDAIVKEWHERYDAYYKKHKPVGKKVPLLITQIDKDFFDKVEEKQFLKEMEQDLDKEFPGFWREVKKPVRYRWIRRAMNKAKKFGYDSHLNNAMVELCARIGLDFDFNPKWKEIVNYIKKDEDGIALSTVYLDFTLFGKNKDYGGTPITNWSLREPLKYLPYPKRPIPKLND